VSTFGISAILQSRCDIDSAVLDLSAVLEGLVGDRFEIIIVGADALTAAELLGRARRVPLKLVNDRGVAEGCAAATYELILIAAEDGQFDVRELNHLLEAVEAGADIAVGYRRRVTDAITHALQRLGWKTDVDCALTLARRDVWERLHCAAPSEARKLGYRVSEVPVRDRRPTIGAPVAA
jgi:hypothetical protein